MSGDAVNALATWAGGGRPPWAGTGGGRNGSGGNNGGSGGSTPTPTTPAAPAFAAAMPGQLEAIAQQLAMGFGQPPAGGDFLAYLNNIYKPMAMPDASSGALDPKWEKEIRGTFEDDYHRMKAAGKTIPDWMERQYGGG